MRIKLTIEYDGAGFCGWQVQPGLRTVQGEIESAIFKLTGEKSGVTASGRTDAGVHALRQVAHFDTQKALGDKFVGGLNFYLPPDVRIISAERADETFHARFSAKNKTYVYLMYESRYDSAILRGRATRIEHVDENKMDEAARLFVGRHDFASFMSTGSDTITTVRNVTFASVERKSGLVVFRVSADGFLYNMVRKMAAALIEIGKGKADKQLICELLGGAAFTKVAPPDGLYLYKVDYNI